MALRSQLDALDVRYAAVLALTPEARALQREPERLAHLAEQYARTGYVRVPHVIEQGALADLAGALWPVLSPLAFQVVVPHVARNGVLTSGGRLRRVDARSLDPDGQGGSLEAVLRAIGLTEFGRLLATELAPVLDCVVGPVGYERVFANLYGEGDYLTAHDDDHMGKRLDVNLSVTLDGACGLRVLVDGMLETQYDADGAIGVLGPLVWHEVPPLLRVPGGPPPRRLTITLRYWPV
jgi:hypothetical protein